MCRAPRQVTTTMQVSGVAGTTSTIRPVPELVVLADQLLAPVPGGTGRYTAELLRSLAVTAPSGWTVSSVVSRHADPEAAAVEGVEGPRVLPMPPRALVALWQAGVPYWPGGDAVHAPTPLAPPRSPVLGRHRGACLTVTVHDTVPWSHPHTLTARGVRWHKAMIGRALRTADAVVVPTRSVATELAELVPVGARVLVIPHGVTPAFASATDPAARSLDLPDRYVLAVGTVEPRKGLDVLVDAMARLHRTVAPAPALLLVGQPGWGGLDPRGLAERHGLAAESVRVLGKVPDADLATIMRRATVLAVPSLAEGFGLPLLEGMAAGVPVVHSDAPALVEVAGGAGIAVPRGDADALATALRTLLADPAWADRLVAAGRARAAEFSWHVAAEVLWAEHVRAYAVRPGERDRSGRHE